MVHWGQGYGSYGPLHPVSIKGPSAPFQRNWSLKTGPQDSPKGVQQSSRPLLLPKVCGQGTGQTCPWPTQQLGSSVCTWAQPGSPLPPPHAGSRNLTQTVCLSSLPPASWETISSVVKLKGKGSWWQQSLLHALHPRQNRSRISLTEVLLSWVAHTC